MPLVVKLPVGIEPDWEVKEAVDEDGDETALKAVNERYCVARPVACLVKHLIHISL